jgi:uncharacterized protein (DUF2141 family)
MGTITLDVTDILNADGLIIGGLYIAETFKRFGGGEPAYRAEAAAVSGTVSLVFPAVAPGRYAAAAYHDQNGNRHLDLNFVGIPAEGRGYSKVTRAGLAAPAFEDAGFDHDEETRLTISLRYPGS